MENKLASFSAANIFPAKILLDSELINTAKEQKKILVRHVQLNPTNRCNLNCHFCSCSNRDKTLEMSYRDIMEIMTKARKCGCLSVTITGGGEPMMHPHINEIITGIHSLGVEVGVVTNGIHLHKLQPQTYKRIRWIRVSSADHRTEYLDRVFMDTLDEAVSLGRNVDWAFSHVVTSSPNYNVMKAIIEFANEHDFTHIRLVSDLLDLDNVPSMIAVRSRLEAMGVDDRLIIYQGRKAYSAGSNPCYISILKPVVSADGKLFPCCGSQYMFKKPIRDYKGEMAYMAKDIDRLFEEQRFFDGSKCVHCYYSDYNYALGVLLSDVRHKKFV